MASYLPSITDYIPQIQEFRPDYNFYGNILQSKQGQFDANHKQLSGVYSTLLNSPMTHDSNIQARDAFFKAIDQDIKKVSGMDLSLSENAASANKIFSNFYNDKYMVNDMVKTKNWMSEQQRGEGFRNCVNPDDCGGQFSETGMQYLEYKRQDFRKASREQTLGMDMGRYIPSQNFTDQAFKAAKDAGFNIKVDSVHGGYIVTTKNGQQLTPQLHDYFMAKFGDDPKMMGMFKRDAYVQRKNYIAQAAAMTGDEAGAENEYISSIMNAVPQQQKAAQKRANDDHDSIANRLTVIQNNAKQNGVTPGDEIDKSFQDLQEQFGITSANKAVQDKAAATIETAQNIKDPTQYKDRIDDIVAYAMLQQHAGTTAQNYAMKDTEVDIKADPYGLATHSSNLSLRNMMAGKEADFNYMLKKEEFKLQAEEKKKAAEQKKLNDIYGLNAQPIRDVNIPGGSTGVIKPQEQVLIDERNRLYGANIITQKAFIKPMVGSIKQAYDAAGQSGVTGGAEQQKLIKDTAKKVFEGTGIDVDKLFNNSTYAEESAKIDGLSMATTKIAYDKALTNINPNAKGLGAENAFWSQSFWNDHAEVPSKIALHEKVILSFDKLYKKNAEETKNLMIGEYIAKDDKEKVAMTKSFTGPDGRKLTKDQFAKDYASKNKNLYFRATPNDRINGIDIDKRAYTDAYSNALSNYDKLNESYVTKYQTIKNAAPESLAMLDNKGGAKTTSGYWYDFEPMVVEHPGTLTGHSIFRNYDDLKNSDPTKVGVKFGDASTTVGVSEEENAKAKKLLDLLEIDFRKVFKEGAPDNDKRPVMKFSSQTVAAGDQNMTAYHFLLNPKWAAVQNKKGGPLEAQLTEDNIKDGITIFIAKDKADNAYFNSNQRTDTDRLLELDGKIDMDSYPKAGKLTLKKIGTDYVIEGFKNQLTIDNTIESENYYETIPEQFGLNAEQLVNGFNEKFKKADLIIQNYNAKYNAKNGIKDLSTISK